ncbi:AraC family transcriptional regulator [Caulobacter sp. S45]|uniref:AraC family transcriptional regulator n=1 Tax=Caulobacter sp. S45 TaxID=1641861 RepID=UPI00131A6E4C|nr:AraC family transcriptional regulator [Caulobacter sp. S45]
MEPLAELRTLIAHHAQPGQRACEVAGVRLLASDAPTEPVLNISEPTFAVVAQGGKRAVLAERVFDYGEGQYLVVGLDLPIVSNVVRASAEQPYLAVGVALKPAAIATLLLETASAGSPAAHPLGMAVSDATPELLEPVVRLLRLLDRPGDIAVLRPMIEREILWRLLAGDQGPMVRQIGLADSRLSQIGHAVRWIRDHYAELLRIEDLARLSAMSPSSFHRHFRAVTAMSPLQYQKQVRLQEARTRLLAQSRDVAAVGYDVGYDSPSQFTREYSRLFGAPPRRDVARLRKLSALERSV